MNVTPQEEKKKPLAQLSHVPLFLQKKKKNSKQHLHLLIAFLSPFFPFSYVIIVMLALKKMFRYVILVMNVATDSCLKVTRELRSQKKQKGKKTQRLNFSPFFFLLPPPTTKNKKEKILGST